MLLAGSLTGSLAHSAAADAIPEDDLAYARLLVGMELLALDFYTRAIVTRHFGADASKYLKRALLNEKEHLRAASGILRGASQTPALAADFDFLYPKGSFGSKASITKLGVRLETAFLGAYLGAVDGLGTDALKQPMARIAASEAQHLSVFTRLAGRGPIGISFPKPVTIDEASNTLDAFTS